MEFFHIINGTIKQIDFEISKEIYNEGTDELFCISSYNEDVYSGFSVDENLLMEAKYFSYVKYESYEKSDFFSLELLDFRDLFSSNGSVVIYINKNICIFFATQPKLILEQLNKMFQSLGEKITINKIIYYFFDYYSKSMPIKSDEIEKKIMDLEHKLITTDGNKDCVREIIYLRNELMILKRYYEQSLYALDIIIENENNFFDENSLNSFEILSKRMERRFQNILNLRDALTQARESYEAEVDISLNETMKFFTVITTIFLPLTLIVGWYGMNFEMPEYNLEYGYHGVIIGSILFVLIGIYYFKKKKWF